MTVIVKDHKGILFPLSLHWASFGFEITFNPNDLKGDADSYDITEDIYEFEEVTEVLLLKIQHYEVRRPLFTNEGNPRFFHFDEKTDKLYLIGLKAVSDCYKRVY